MKIKRVLVATALLAMSANGTASTADQVRQYHSGNTMLRICEDDDLSVKALCFFYMSGISDTLNTIDGLGIIPEKLFCAPKEVTPIQLRLVFIKYANDHAEGLHNGASGIAMAAFAEAFPCK
jgi:hypothetical protein